MCVAERPIPGAKFDYGVSEEYRGSKRDQEEMKILGKDQVLRRNFNLLTMVGFASTVMTTWELMLIMFTYVLTDGGTGILFWGFIVAACGMFLVYASIAEMASISPTAGGQYHWVSEFAPRKRQKFLSYMVGWLTATGWQVYLSGVCFMVGGIIQGLIALNVEAYIPQAWHCTLLTIAVVAFSIIFNTVLAGYLPSIEALVLILHVLGFFGIAVPLWVLAPISHPRDVLLNFTNNGGWSSDRISAMVGLYYPLCVLVGYDCSVHMAEEIKDSSRVLPKAIMWSIGLNAVLGFLMAVTLIFTMGDVNSILDTPTGQPFMQVFFNATQSYAATNVMCAIVIIILCSCCISEVATASRQIWSFARDGGLPASTWLSKTNLRLNLPVRAVTVTFLITSLLSCINLGSSVTLSAINSLGGVSLLISYSITISCFVWRRFQGPLPQHQWDLGRSGMAINIGALVFLLPVALFAFWPLTTPVTASTMNWASVMFVGVMVVALVHYIIWGKNNYEGPVLKVKRSE
ncbi:amino acid transporter-like protein [Aureobasidium sp. EXF-3400]|nr:amino acid transporter-like protein [Aureobasidium sp. EXF-3400]